MLGLLVAPVIRYCEGEEHSPSRGRELRAQLQAELPEFVKEVERYGAGYPSEIRAVGLEFVEHLVPALVHFTYDDPSGPMTTKDFVEMSVRKVKKLLGDFPRRPLEDLMSAGTPLGLYRSAQGGL